MNHLYSAFQPGFITDKESEIRQHFFASVTKGTRMDSGIRAKEEAEM